MSKKHRGNLSSLNSLLFICVLNINDHLIFSANDLKRKAMVLRFPKELGEHEMK